MRNKFIVIVLSILWLVLLCMCSVVFMNGQSQQRQYDQLQYIYSSRLETLETQLISYNDFIRKTLTEMLDRQTIRYNEVVRFIEVTETMDNLQNLYTLAIQDYLSHAREHNQADIITINQTNVPMQYYGNVNSYMDSLLSRVEEGAVALTESDRQKFNDILNIMNVVMGIYQQFQSESFRNLSAQDQLIQRLYVHRDLSENNTELNEISVKLKD